MGIFNCIALFAIPLVFPIGGERLAKGNTILSSSVQTQLQLADGTTEKGIAVKVKLPGLQINQSDHGDKTHHQTKGEESKCKQSSWDCPRHYIHLCMLECNSLRAKRNEANP